MPRDARAYLRDVHDAGRELSRFTADKSWSDYKSDRLLQLAVERAFITIGEAVNQATKIDPSLTAKITYSRRVVDFRNKLTHAYWLIANHVVWETVQEDLPQLMREIEELLDAP